MATLVLDEFVARFRLVYVFGGGGDDWIDAMCPWCGWRYPLPVNRDGDMGVVLGALNDHMTAEHR